MTEVLYKLVADCETKSESYIPLSKAEIAEREAAAIAAQEAEAARLVAEAEAAEKKAAVLTALATAAGLTVEEVTAALA